MEKQNSESEDDFITMQQEAIRRVREMQSRARATLENAGMHIEKNEVPDVPPSPSETVHTNFSVPPPNIQTGSHSGKQHANAPRQNTSRPIAQYNDNRHESQRTMEKHSPHPEEPPVIRAPGLNIAIESDQLMLLLTLYLLIKDGADKWLILALAYVMLS